MPRRTYLSNLASFSFSTNLRLFKNNIKTPTFTFDKSGLLTHISNLWGNDRVAVEPTTPNVFEVEVLGWLE